MKQQRSPSRPAPERSKARNQPPGTPLKNVPTLPPIRRRHPKPEEPDIPNTPYGNRSTRNPLPTKEDL